jgi:hypothetical protein
VNRCRCHPAGATRFPTAPGRCHPISDGPPVRTERLRWRRGRGGPFPAVSRISVRSCGT